MRRTTLTGNGKQLHFRIIFFISFSFSLLQRGGERRRDAYSYCVPIVSSSPSPKRSRGGERASVETRCRMGRTQNRRFRPKKEASNLEHNICSSIPSPPRAAGMLPSWGWVGGPTDDQEYPILCLSLPPPHSSEYYWKYSQQAGGRRRRGLQREGGGA